MSKSRNLTTEMFDAEVVQSDLPVVIDFHATWCGPCRMLGPVLDTLADRYAGRVKVLKVDVDQAPELAGRFNITGVPTLVFFANGKPIGRQVGLATPQALQQAFEELAGTSATTQA